MRLTVMSDYSLRVLMYLAVEPGRRATIQQIATSYQISDNHLMKVVHKLAQIGFVTTVRGRGGGLTLGKPASQITIGAVLRATEDDHTLVECFGAADACRITSACRLKRVLQQALQAYFDVLDRSTLADLVAKPKALADLLDIREEL